MKKKTLHPKKIFYRALVDGHISFGEYVNGKWRNICNPIHRTKELYRYKNLGDYLNQCFKGRGWILVPYSLSPATPPAEEIQALFNHDNKTA